MPLKGGQVTRLRQVPLDLDKVVKMPYVPELSENLRRNLRPLGVETVFSNSQNNRRFFTKLKSKVPVKKMSSVVYQIDCKDCPGKYIGHTKRYLQERIRSHRNDQNESTSLHQHEQEKGHNFDFENPKVLVREKLLRARMIHEAIQVQKCRAAVNARGDTQCLSAIYKKFI